jgi:hypothetical protein
VSKIFHNPTKEESETRGCGNYIIVCITVVRPLNKKSLPICLILIYMLFRFLLHLHLELVIFACKEIMANVSKHTIYL